MSSKQSTRRGLKDSTFALWVTVPVAMLLIGMVIYPLIFSFTLSTNSFRVREGKIQQNFIGFENYDRALNDERVINSIGRTLVYGFEGVGLGILLSIGIALILNEAFRGRGVLRVFALLPWAVSDFMTGVSWKWIWIQGFGLVDSVLLRTGLAEKSSHYITNDSAIHILAIAEAWHIAPLGGFFILAGMQVIPEDIIRQARIDGAGAFRRFFQVKLPLIRYSLLITVVISTLFIWEALDVVLLLTGGGPGVATQTLPYMVYREFFSLFHLGYGAAISYLLLGIVIVVALTWFRLLSRGA